MVEKNYLTQEGFDKLQAEYQNLKTTKIPEVLQRIKDASAQGDISENAEYETAMQDKEMIEARMIKLEDMLQNVEIIKEGKKGGIIKYGSKVTIKDEKDQTFEYTMVGSGEVDILNNFTISFDSSLGKALKGKKVGDMVVVKAPRGKDKVWILDVK